MIFDSNLIIYSAKPEYWKISEYMRTAPIAVSRITHLEVLGFHSLSEAEAKIFKVIFELADTYECTAAVVDLAIDLRQQKSMSLGDSVIAATALLQGLPLATHNTKDFHWVNDLGVIDPLALT